MRRRKWLERAKSLLIAVLALTVLALTVLALPAKTVTDTPWLAALVRPFAAVMGLTQGELTATPMADAASVTGAAQPVAVSVRNPAGRTSFQFDTAALDTAFDCLKEGGRLAVITFHSLEDRLVKQRFAAWRQGCVCPPDFPVCVCGRTPAAEPILRKPAQASPAELKENPRARSAKLRCVRRLHARYKD